MTQKNWAPDNILKPIYHPYKIKEGHSKLHWKMKHNTVTYVKKIRNLHPIHLTCSWGKHTPRKCHNCTFRGCTVGIGCIEPTFTSSMYTNWVCVPANQTKCFFQHLRLSGLNFPDYCHLRICCRLYKGLNLLPFWCAFHFITCFDFCLSHKDGFIGVSDRVAAALVFIVVFALPFLSAAGGKGRSCSGIMDVLE